jgi:hypothetical protein
MISVLCIGAIFFYFQDTQGTPIPHFTSFDRLEQSHLFGKQSKCVFCQDQVALLGFLIDREGISMDPDRVKTVQEWPAPESVHDIQVFLGFANLHRRFLTGYSRIAPPITDLTKKTCTSFSWTEQADATFERLNTAFSSPPLSDRR